MKSDLLLAVTQLAAERSLPARVVVTAVQDALTAAYKRDQLSGGEDVEVIVDPETGDVTVHTVRNVVEDIEDEGAEWTLDQARESYPDAELGDRIQTGVIEQNPGRIAAQTAKQLVMQRLREAERELVYDEFVDREGEVVTATIQRVDSRYITMDLGRAEAIMPPPEQVSSERYRPGMRLKVYISEVRRTVRGPEIIASRTHIQLMRRLFETEVPEIFNGVVEIRGIAREPGARSKVAVHSTQEGVDPVGACVGLRGIRIQNVVNELMGEKIDVVEWSDDPTELIASSLSPAQVDRVVLDEAEQTATVLVPDRQLSLAIGREGQNARLAAKLTNWHIDVKSTAEAQLEEAARIAAEATPEPEPESAAVEDEPAAAEAVDEPAVVDDEAETVVEPEPVTAEHESEDSEETLDEKTAAIIEDATPAEGDVSAEEELALAALEEELKVLEAQEKEEQEARERELAAAAKLQESEDVWQVGDFGGSEEPAGLRFAEDILEYRDMTSGRRSRRGRGGQNLSPKARRAAARKQAGNSSNEPAKPGGSSNNSQ